MIEGYIVFTAFIAGVLAGIATLSVYELHCRRKSWRTLTLGLDDFDIRCINEEYQRRKKLKGKGRYNHMTKRQRRLTDE